LFVVFIFSSNKLSSPAYANSGLRLFTNIPSWFSWFSF
jgi:hypothetical protein